MKITAENYEQWALDYLEGTLSKADRADFECFLEGNAHAAEEIRLLQNFMPVAQAEPVAFPEPGTLMRSRSVTPLRRLLSLVSGAAAAAILAGGFMFLDRSTPATWQAMNSTSAPDSTPVDVLVPEAVVAAVQEAPEQPVVSEAATVETSAEVRTDGNGVSRVARWNRKTAEWLEKMEARNERRNQQARLLAEACPDEMTGHQGTEPVAVAAVEASASSDWNEYAETFRTEKTAPQHAAYENLASESLTRMKEETSQASSSSLHTEALYASESLASEESLETQSWSARRERRFLRTLLGPLEKISPIKYYEDEEGRGVEIASILRIGSRTVDADR